MSFANMLGPVIRRPLRNQLLDPARTAAEVLTPGSPAQGRSPGGARK